MTILPRTRRGVWLTAAAVWLAGCAALWAVLPVRPEAEWSAPANSQVAAALADGRTLVVRENLPTDADRTPAGRLWFWNAGSGRHRAIDATRNGRRYDALSQDGRWLAFLARVNDREYRVTVMDTAANAVHVEWVYPWDGFYRDRPAGFSGDGLLAVVGTDRSERFIRIYDVPARRLRQVILDAAEFDGFSADGRLLFANWVRSQTRPGEYDSAVWDLDRGAFVAAMPYLPEWRLLAYSDGRCYGTLVNRLQCYEAGTGRELWATEPTKLWRLAPDGRSVCSVELDLEAGEPRLVRRRLPDGAVVRRAAPGDRNPIDCGYPPDSSSAEDISRDARWAVTLPGDGERFGWVPDWIQQRLIPDSDTWVRVRLIDMSTGRSQDVASGRYWGAGFFPDGHSFWTSDSKRVYAVWGLPPRPPLSWFAAGAVAWAAPLALLARRRVRRFNSCP